MALISLDLPPGIFGQGTKYQSKGRWRDAQLVRFLEGRKEPVGGWVTLPTSGASISGVPRTMLGWRISQSGSPSLAVGTNSHIYTFTAGVLTDRTIYNITTGTVDTTVSGNLYGTGLYGTGLYGRGDPTQSSEVAPGIWHLDTFGNYLLGVLSSDARILIWNNVTATMQPLSNTAASNVFTVAGTISDGDTLTIGGKLYTWETSLTNVDGHVAIGGSNAVALTNMAAGINLTTGAGTLYATAMTQSTVVTAAAGATTLTVTQRVYSGTALVVSEVANGAWGAGTAGATGNAPTTNRGVVVTAERFIMALGANGGALSSTGGDRTVAWSSQETTDDWTASAVNTAGDFTLPGSGRIVCGRRGRNETLIFTETDLFSAQYIGGTLIYAFTQLGSGCGIIGPNAVAVVDGKAAWMTTNGFAVYDGFVRPVPSDVSDYVFSDFNIAQRIKCYTTVVADRNEVWFHYPSALSTEPDRYVIWNHTENHWTPGQLARTASASKGAFEYPLMATSAGVIWQHENGTTHSGETAPFLESGPIELGTGDRVFMVRQIIPDDVTRQSSGRSVAAYLKTSFYPNEAETTYGPYTLTSPTSVRLTARQPRLRISEIAADDWRIGVLRLDVVVAGER